MKPEFFHIEAYALKATGGKGSALGVLSEASRLAGYHPHVPSPRTPILLFGCTPDEVGTRLKALNAIATDRGKRRLPRTFPTLLTAVASYPVMLDGAIEAEHFPAPLKKWIALNLAFFTSEFERALVSVIAHTDEAYFHLHAYALPTPDAATGAVSIEAIWPALAAQGAVRREGGSRKQQREAFRAEGKKVQNRYFEAVGRPCNLARDSVQRSRLSRGAYMDIKQREAELAKRHEEIESLSAQLRQREAELQASFAGEDERRRAAYAAAAADMINEHKTEMGERMARVRAEVKQILVQLRDLAEENSRLSDRLREAGIDPTPPALISPHD